MSNLTPQRKKVGLALSGGAARGFAHIGVLQVLQKEGIPIDMVAGTSAGAVVGAAYARNRDIARITQDSMETNWKKMAPLIDLSFSRSGLIKGKKLINLLTTYVGEDIEFQDLEVPFACTATDIETGEEIVIDSGRVIDALRATISMPGIFSVFSYKGRLLVDGGLTTPVPVEIVKQMGADFVIAVNVNPDVAARAENPPGKQSRTRKLPNLFQILAQSTTITTSLLARTNLAAADVVIEPDLAYFKLSDFNKAPDILNLGIEAAERAVGEIKGKLQRI